MEARIRTPTWRDVNISDSLINLIKESDDLEFISFLVNDRVFHKENKINYQYVCGSCGYSKLITRQYEDYSSCEDCRSKKIQGFPHWKYHRHGSAILNTTNVIVDKMVLNLNQYFGKKFDNAVDFNWDDGFKAKFFSGDQIVESNPTLAIAKASVLCPFLWDANYNWRDFIHNDCNNDLHIPHILLQWVH